MRIGTKVVCCHENAFIRSFIHDSAVKIANRSDTNGPRVAFGLDDNLPATDWIGIECNRVYPTVRIRPNSRQPDEGGIWAS